MSSFAFIMRGDMVIPDGLFFGRIQERLRASLFITSLSAASPANSVQQDQSDEHNPAKGSSRGTKAYASLKAAAKRAGWIQQYQDLERGLQSAAEKPRGKLPKRSATYS